VAKDAVNFAAIQMTVAIVLFGLAILAAASRPPGSDNSPGVKRQGASPDSYGQTCEISNALTSAS
jgi:hypothetical protein